jgi:tryptophanyl-tRNA synthetase
MSKSASSPNGVLDLLDDPKVNAKRIRSAVTDTGRDVRYDPEGKPGVSNLLTIYSALSGRDVPSLEEQYAGKGYGDLKKDLAEVVTDTLGPVRERALELLENPDTLDEILAEGARRARERAGATLERVYDRVGFLPGKR